MRNAYKILALLAFYMLLQKYNMFMGTRSLKLALLLINGSLWHTLNRIPFVVLAIQCSWGMSALWKYKHEYCFLSPHARSRLSFKENLSSTHFLLPLDMRYKSLAPSSTIARPTRRAAP